MKKAKRILGVVVASFYSMGAMEKNSYEFVYEFVYDKVGNSAVWFAPDGSYEVGPLVSREGKIFVAGDINNTTCLFFGTRNCFNGTIEPFYTNDKEELSISELSVLGQYLKNVRGKGCFEKGIDPLKLNAPNDRFKFAISSENFSSQGGGTTLYNKSLTNTRKVSFSLSPVANKFIHMWTKANKIELFCVREDSDSCVERYSNFFPFSLIEDEKNRFAYSLARAICKKMLPENVDFLGKEFLWSN